MNLCEVLAINLKYYRKKYKLSQEKFAETLKKSNVSVSRKMNGKVGFSQNDMVEWGNLLHIPLEEYGEFFFT